MPLALLAIPPAQAESRPLWGLEEAPYAQGVEGRHLHDAMTQVWRHWTDRTDSTNGGHEPVDDTSYNHVRLPTVATLRVRYSAPQPLRPRRFTLDDDQ